MYGVRQEIEAVKFLLSSFFGRPDEAERFESIKVKAASNESIKVYAGFSMVQLQEQLVVLQNQLFAFAADQQASSKATAALLVQNDFWLFRCTLKGGRCRKCFCANVYKVAEDNLAFVRTSEADGIFAINEDVNIQLVFKEEAWMLKFESAILLQCATTTSNKKPRYDDEEPVETKPSGEDNEEEEEEETNLFEVTIAALTMSAIPRADSYGDLQRVYRYGYVHEVDENGVFNSLPCNTFSDAMSMSVYEAETATIVEAESRVQMLEDHTHTFFLGKNAEVAHIKDKARCTPAEARNINNRLYLSRHLHEAFDGINTNPVHHPWFVLHYVSHDAEPVDCPKIGDDAIIAFPYRKRHRMVVEVVFFNEQSKNAYVGFLRTHSRQIDLLTYQLELFFEDPVKAKKFLDWKENKTRARWTRE